MSQPKPFPLKELHARPRSVLIGSLFRVRANAQGTSDFFSQCLFLLMNRQYNEHPSKKKAILIYEVFIAGNKGTQSQATDWVYLKTEKERSTASILNFNTEAGGGVAPEKIHSIYLNIQKCREAFAISEKKNSFVRFFTNKNQKIASTLPIPPNQTFADMDIYIKRLLDSHWSAADENDALDDGIIRVRKALTVVGPAAKSAGFNMGKIGLNPDGSI